ncbi:AMP-binding enzyme [Streptomyces sp. NPDC002911]
MISVREACGVGVPDETWGEAVRAVGLPGPGSAGVTADELTAFRAECLDRFKKPRAVDFVSALPHTETAHSTTSGGARTAHCVSRGCFSLHKCATAYAEASFGGIRPRPHVNYSYYLAHIDDSGLSLFRS